MVADIDADLRQSPDGEGVDVARRLRTGAFHAEGPAKMLAQNRFGEVGAAGIAGAEDEDGGWVVHADAWRNSPLRARVGLT